MRPRLPPLNALNAFEAAARHELYTRGRRALRHARCRQPPGQGARGRACDQAVQPRAPAADHHGSGRDYLAVVRDALDRIAIGTERLLQRQSAGVLTVSTSPDFAAKWLVHRLGHFAEAHTGIDLRVSAAMHHVDFAREDVDMAVRHGEGNWPGLDAVQLCTEQLFAICSPKLLSGRRLGKLADLLKFPLIHLESRSDWTKWLRVAGMSDDNIKDGPVLNRASMVIDAAVNGQGIALARTTLAAWDLINGRLVRPFSAALPLSKTYWIVCPKATSNVTKIVRFRDWLLAEASQDMRQLKKLGRSQ